MKYSIGLIRSAPEKRPIFLRFRSSEALIISTVALAIFTDIFLYGEIIPILPFALESRVGVEHNSVQSSVSILLAMYAAGLIAASPIVGWTADHFETRRSSLMAGLAALLGSTFMLCFGRTEAVLIIARVLQGISAAVVWTVGLALIVDTVGEARVGQAMAYASSAMSIGLVLGPVLGGVLYERRGYYSAFILAFAIIGFDLILRIILVEKKIAVRYTAPPQVTEQENSGSIKLQPVQPAAETSEASESRPEPERSSSSTTPAISSSRGSRLPPVIRILKYPRLLVALFLSFVQALILSAFDATLPLYLNALFNFTALEAGLVYMSVALPVFFISPLAGWLCDRFGPKIPAVGGLLFSVPFLILLRIPHSSQDDQTGQVAILCAILALLGCTLTFVIPPSMSEIALIAGEHGGAYGQAYGLFNVAFSGGFLVGPLWGGYVTEKAGWGIMVGSLAGLAGVSAIPVAIWTGGWISWRDMRSHFAQAFRKTRRGRERSPNESEG